MNKKNFAIFILDDFTLLSKFIFTFGDCYICNGHEMRKPWSNHICLKW